MRPVSGRRDQVPSKRTFARAVLCGTPAARETRVGRALHAASRSAVAARSASRVSRSAMRLEQRKPQSHSGQHHVEGPVGAEDRIDVPVHCVPSLEGVPQAARFRGPAYGEVRTLSDARGAGARCRRARGRPRPRGLRSDSGQRLPDCVVLDAGREPDAPGAGVHVSLATQSCGQPPGHERQRARPLQVAGSRPREKSSGIVGP